VVLIFRTTPFQGVPPTSLITAVFQGFAPILPDALSRYDEFIHHTKSSNHDGTNPIIRFDQGGRT
jgi:hypothetical protein